jgi:hypothetical protein
MALPILPLEIIHYIHSFAPEHRIKFKTTLHRLSDEYIRRKLIIIEEDPEYHGQSVQFVILKHIGKTELERWSHECYYCNCCKKHQRNKTLIVYNKVKVLNRPSEHIKFDRKCKIPCDGACWCKCRHFGRWLARALHN